MCVSVLAAAARVTCAYNTKKKHGAHMLDSCMPLPLNGAFRGGLQSKIETAVTQTIGGGGGVLNILHGRIRMAIDPLIPTMPGRSTSGVHPQGRHCLHQAQTLGGAVPA